MKRTVNNRFEIIDGISKPIFPCYMLEFEKEDKRAVLKFESSIYVHEKRPDNSTDIYHCPIKKFYYIPLDNVEIINDIEDVIENFTNIFMTDCCANIRYSVVAKGLVNSEGEPIMKFVKTIPVTNYLELLEYN